MNKLIHVIGGGTVAHIRNHLALSAPAYGNTARELAILCDMHPDNKLSVSLHLTKMAGGAGSNSTLETNEDVAALIDNLVGDPRTKIVFFNAALVDFEPKQLLERDDEYGIRGARGGTKIGKYAPRLKTSEVPELLLKARPADKLISRVRRTRKDIFLVGFKTTCGATEDEQYLNLVSLLNMYNCVDA